MLPGPRQGGPGFSYATSTVPQEVMVSNKFQSLSSILCLVLVVYSPYIVLQYTDSKTCNNFA